MRKIIIIGTIHNMLPKHKKEIESILNKINPDQVLVEIDREINLKSSQIKKYPKEMIFAYNWAIKNNKKFIKGPAKEVIMLWKAVAFPEIET